MQIEVLEGNIGAEQQVYLLQGFAFAFWNTELSENAGQQGDSTEDETGFGAEIRARSILQIWSAKVHGNCSRLSVSSD